MGKPQLRQTDNVIPFVPPDHARSEFSDAVADDIETAPKIRHSTRTLAIVFTDLVGSSAIKSELGIHKAQNLELEHKRLLLDALRIIRNLYRDNTAQAVRSEGDSYIFVFSNSGEAVHFALLAQRLHRVSRSDHRHELPQFRVGIHTGEVIVEDGLKGPKHSGGIGDIKGLQADTAARIMGLASGGQILCSYTAFDNARQSLTGIDAEGIPDKLIWKRHGAYLLKGREDSLEICEVGEEGAAPLKKPVGNEKAKSADILKRIPKSVYISVFVLLLILSGISVYSNYFRASPPRLTAAEAVVDEVKHKIIRLHGVYETIKDYGSPAAMEIREKAPNFAGQLLNLSDEKMGLMHRILKYQFATYALGMAASAEISESEAKYYGNQAVKYADRAIQSGNEGLRLIAEAKSRASSGNKNDCELYDWIVSPKREEVIHFMLALSFAVKVKLGDDASVAGVKKHLYAMPSSYKERYKPETEKLLKWVIDNKLR